MIFRRTTWQAGLAALAAAFAAAPSVEAQGPRDPLPEGFKDVGLVSKLGEQVPLDLTFTSSEGKRVALSSYLNSKRPVVLVPAYFRCPMTCPLMLERLQQGLNGLSYIVGEDFTCLVVSFDPTETAQAAASNRQLYLGGYTKPLTPAAKAGWEFLVSPDSAAATLCAAVGFQYKYIPESGQYSHPAALIVLTPEGKVARYVSGLDYTPQDIRMALLEASEGKIAQSLGDFFVHLCYRFDPTTGKYTMHAFRFMQLGAILTATGVVTLIVGLRASERLKRHRREVAARPQPGAPGTPSSSVSSLIGQAR